MERRDFVKYGYDYVDVYRQLMALAKEELRCRVKAGKVEQREVLHLAGIHVKEMTLEGQEMMVMNVEYYSDSVDMSGKPTLNSFSFDLLTDRDLDPNLAVDPPGSSL